ncbi:ferritin family protein [Thermococcus stetteri]|uniref:ferritin family protein n=1 Tax=Thermococcus stetteri TaxID=49900 RepID=UPI001AE222AE|nr:ferritin family protein [Thermococcus stetteri]MBP1911646.1 rubrerythrin [Thermococcus stetteri]
MGAEELIKRIIWQENELYNLYKLGETFALFERPDLKDDFAQLAEEELRHRKTLEGLLSEGSLKNMIFDYVEELELEPMVHDERAHPESLEELVVEALIREKHAYELYTRLAEILDGSLSHIFKMMAGEELKHAYRLRLIYEKIDG